MNIKKIAIDAGHNAPKADTGAVGVLKEDFCIKQVMQHLTGMLSNYQLVLVAPKSAVTVRESLNSRTYAANISGADLYISLHFNAFNKQANGTEIFLSSLRQDRPIYKVAKRILDNLVGLGYKNRGLKTSNLHVINNTTMPAMLIEVCFIDNVGDCKKFDAKKIAAAIANGIKGTPDIPRELDINDEKQKAKITITANTFFKPSTAQSVDIPASKLKGLSLGMTFDVNLLCDEESHFEVEILEGGLKGSTGFIYHEHCKLSPYLND
jgi:N-acetylmuramoyl-L-alanine amidase